MIDVLGRRLAACTLAALLGACQSAARFDADAPGPDAVAQATVSGIGEPGFPTGAPLRQGAWQGAPFEPGAASRPELLLLATPQASGDLDGDGAGERAVLLAASSGGSGERIYLAVFGAREGRAVQRAGVLVGDRSKPRALSIEQGEVLLDVVEIGPGQPSCCGTQLARHRYRLQGDRLEQTAHEVQGELSAAVLEGEWTLAEMDGAPLPALERAPTLVFREGSAGGFGGCNSFRGQLAQAAPGEFTPGPHAFMATRMYCEPPRSTVEDAYLRALGHAARYRMSDGRLLIEWVEGERKGLLLFAR